MKSLLYLVLKEMKNTLMEILHKPGKLVAYIFVGAMVLFSVFANSSKPMGEEGFFPTVILQGAYLVLLLFIFSLIYLNGLKSGTTFFGMSDVNYIFVSPISNKLVLVYGLLRQMGSSLLVAVFLLCYGPTLMRMFDLSWGGVAALFFGFLFTMLFAQVAALLTYGLTNGHPGRVNAAKGALFAVLALTIAMLAGLFFAGGGDAAALERAVISPLLNLVPVAGWVRGAAFGVITNSINQTIIYSAVLIIGLAACLTAFIKGNIDYYEDVMQSTEATYFMKQAKKDGKMPTDSTRNIKVTVTGIGRGWGASAIFFRHLCEARRRSRFVLVNLATVALALGSAVFALIMGKLNSDGASETGVTMLIILCLNCYILFFLNTASGWSRDQQKPYIFLIPESPFKKLCWATLSSMLKPAIDGVLIFTLSGIVLGASVSAIVSCILLYLGLGVLFIAGDVLSMRVLGGVSNKGLLVVLYMVLLGLLLLPGAVVSAVLFFGVGIPGVAAALPCLLWNLGVSVGIFALCRNILNTTELAG